MTAPSLVFGAQEERLRQEFRAWLADNSHDGFSPASLEDIDALRSWQAKLSRAGWIGLSWPISYGGRGLPITAEAIIAEELPRADMPELINRLALYTVAPTLLDFGTSEQCSRFLPGMMDASQIWCQGFSEPGAGSDLAAVRAMATMDGDQLMVRGQKVWTSRSHVAKWCAALVRTDLESSHDGFSLIAVDMTSPGVTIRPLLQVLHEPHFGEVFFDDVRVPLENVIGKIGGGWPVAMAMLGYERGLFVLERQMRIRRRLEQLADRIDGSVDRHHGMLVELGSAVTAVEMLRAQVYKTLAAQADRVTIAGSTSVDKLLLSGVDQSLAALTHSLLHPSDALLDNEWTREVLRSRAVSIYSGTSEVQRNIIASKLLGLHGRG
jgi:alkylation response protein AidB-like acyl-CoA dehydrogenase